jgi:hypothetical protein
MTRIINGKVLSDEEARKHRYGPFAFIAAMIASVVEFIKLFFRSIFNPRSLTNSYRKPPGSGGGPAGPKRPTIINRIKPAENCRAGT